MSSDSAGFIPAGIRERLAAPLLRLAVRMVLRPALSARIPIARQRGWLRQLARFTLTAGDIDIQAGVEGGASGERLRPRGPGNAQAKATILYLHGGGYCVGSAATHRAITSRLTRATGLRVFAADYRLAPEHPFPAAVEDSISAYRSLSGIGPVVIAGDSAGGGLALATAHALRQRQIAIPAALVLLSPWVDLAPSAIPDQAPPGEAMLSARWLNDCAKSYLAGQDATTPLASPQHGDLRGLPPTLIQAGADELLHDQAVTLNDALREAGVAVRCEIVPARWHAFQLHAGMLPSADAAIERAGQFIRACLP